jgi:hypothetical protein
VQPDTGKVWLQEARERERGGRGVWAAAMASSVVRAYLLPLILTHAAVGRNVKLEMMSRVSHVSRFVSNKCQRRRSLTQAASVIRCQAANSVPQVQSEKEEASVSSSRSSSQGGGRRRLPKGSSDGSSTDGTSSREDIRTLRIKKVEDMRTGGYEPYGYTWERTDTAQELQSKYADLASATEANEEKDHVSVAGRIMARRVFGKLAFLTLRDDSGPIQLYCEKARIKDAAFDQLKTSLDVGDFVGAKGTIKRTEKGR